MPDPSLPSNHSQSETNLGPALSESKPIQQPTSDTKPSTIKEVLNMNVPYSSHPRFKEWMAEKNEVQKNSILTDRVLSFDRWLTEKEEEETRKRKLAETKFVALRDTRPRIRGVNPPPDKLEEAQRRKYEYQIIDWTEYLLMALATLLGITIAVAGSFLGLVVIAIPLGLAYVWISGKRKHLDQLPAATNLPIPLHVYNREFTAPLADNSVVRTNIFFTLPVSLARLDTQLDTVTEKEFLIFVAHRTTPPSAEDIQNHLSTRLVTFQNENQIPVLRVEVSLHIHIPSQKPKGGGIVSV